MNTFSTRTRRGAAILFSGVLVLGGLALTGEATAGEDVEGNPTCEDLGYTYTYKVESPTAGTYTVDRDGMKAILTVGTHVDHAEPNPNNAIVGVDISTSAQYAVIVKGGPGATVYENPTSGDLYAPAVASGKLPTISHFQLCWNGPGPQPELGTVVVTKVVAGDAPVDDEYTICLEGPMPSTERECTTIEGAGTLTFDDLAPGSYTVAEEDPGDDYDMTITDATVEVTTAEPATVTVTNRFIEQQSFPPTAPETPTVPEAPVSPEAPATPQAPATAASETALPATGSEGGIAAVAAIVLASGIALTLLGRRREAQQT